MEVDILVEPRASIRNAIDPYLRVLVIIGVLLAMLAVVTILATDDADAWSTSTDYASYGDYEFGYVSSSGGTYIKYNVDSYTHTSYYYYDWQAPTAPSYRSYLSIYIGDWDEKTFVAYDSSYRNFLYLRTHKSSSADSVIRVRMIRGDAINMEARQLWNAINDGYDQGTITIDTSHDYHYVYLSAYATVYIRSAVANGDDWIHFGFEYVSGSSVYVCARTYYTYYGYNYYSFLRTYIDASSPNAPTMSSLNTYTASSSVTVNWAIPSDRPSAPNRGVYGCELGVFSSSISYTPIYTRGYYTTSTTAVMFTGLSDGQTYYFRGRARDYSLFESGWGSAVSTTIDLSPPTVPVLKQEPLFTAGSTNIIEWAASTDAGVGGVWYQVQYSTNADFTGASTGSTASTQATFIRLASGATYYYRIRSVDSFGHYSGWSVPQSSTMDATAPTVPLMMGEPLYTQGTENTFNWHPSTDAGIGVAQYRVQVADSPSFGPGTIVLDTTTGATSVHVTGLRHGSTYHAQVMASDAFGYSSAWSNPVSSRQDDLGPHAPGLQALPTYSMEGPVQLNWDGSVDSGIGTSWYLVEWSNMSDFSDDHRAQYHVLGHTFTVTAGPLINETWYFRVTPYDRLENMGTSEVVSTTIDGTAPNASVIDAMPMFTPGNEVSVSWSDAEDDLSGVDHYVLHVFATAGRGLVFTDTTNNTTTAVTVPGLADGSPYWFQVIAVDVAGNAIASATESTTMDASPPTVPQLGLLPRFTAGTDVTLSWLPSMDAGIGGVEHMLEWALDPEFTVGVEATDWMTGTSYDVMDLTDGQTYYFRVKARDGFGHMSMHSALVMTTMDASPPGVPTMMEMDAFVPGPMVPVMWSPVSDGSGMPVVYQVMAYDTDEAGATPVATSPWLMDTRYTFMGLDPDAEHWFKVVSKDHLAWVSDPSDAVSTTIDTAGPSEASIGEIPEFTAGSGLKVMWTAGTDDGVGGVTTRLVVYSDEALSIPVHSSEWTDAGEASVYGLADGSTYWFVVEGRDGFLNTGEASEAAMTTMDASAPTLVADLHLFGPNDGEVSGTYADATSGIDTVEVSSDGETWFEATLDDGVWTMDVVELDHGDVWVRATDLVGNMLPATTMCTVDTMAPQVIIYEPAPSTDVFTAVVISGTIADDNLIAYHVAYQKAGDNDWYPVQSEQETNGIKGVLATWLTAGLSGGEYIIKVTAFDDVELSNYATVTVTLKGAKLSLSASDITFSDTHPLPDDKVMVMATVRNTGDSPAEDVTVTVYQDGTAVGEETGVTVPAHGTYTMEVQVKAKEGGAVYTARASSPLYDTGETSSGQPLNTIEPESTLENSAGILALLALIVALIALLLIIMGKMGGKKEEPVPEPEEDVLVDPVIDMEVLEPEPMPGEDPMRPRTQ